MTRSKQLVWCRLYKQSCSLLDRNQPHTKTIIQGSCVQKFKSFNGILEILCFRKAKAVKKSFGFCEGRDKVLKTVKKVSSDCPHSDVLFIA